MKKLFLFILPLLFLVACKKKEADPPQEEPAPVPQPAGTYYGAFAAEKRLFWADTNQNGYVHRTKVWLYSKPVTEGGLYSPSEKLGIVKSNNTQLRYFSYDKCYDDSTYSVSYSTQISFQHTSTAIGNINYTSADTFPNIPSRLAAQIMDTLDKTKNFVVPLTYASNFTQATCILDNGAMVSNGIRKTVASGATGFTFTPSEISGIPSGQTYFVTLILRKIKDEPNNGKLVRFENDTYSSFSFHVK